MAWYSGAGRRQILWLGVTANPSAEWMARQLTEACGWEWTPKYIVRDRDSVYGEIFTRRFRAMGIRDRGSIRRECLDHVVVLASGTCATYSFLIWSITTARGHTSL
jgi:hypothetical protein